MTKMKTRIKPGIGALLIAVFALTIAFACTLEPSITDIHKAVIEASGFQVTFMDDDEVLFTSRTVGGKVILPKHPVDDTDTFGWWYEEDSCDTPWDFQNNRVTKDMKLYAAWNTGPGKPTIVFFANGGKFSSSPDIIFKEAFPTSGDAGNTVSVSSPTRDGYDFNGKWYPQANGGGEQFNTGSYHVDESMAVYAQWNVLYSVTSNGESGTTRTTKIHFVFEDDIRRLGLIASNINLVVAPPTQISGTLSHVKDGKEYDLSITGTFANGVTVTVSIDKPGIDPGTKSVTLHTPVLLTSGSLGTGGNNTITIPPNVNEYYILEDMSDNALYYTKEDGTLTSDLSLIGPLNTDVEEITGTPLTNGNTYRLAAAKKLTGSLDIFDHPAGGGYVPDNRSTATVANGEITLRDDGEVLWGINLKLPLNKTYELMRIVTDGSPSVSSTSVSAVWTTSKCSGVYDLSIDDFASDYPPTAVGLYIIALNGGGVPSFINGMSIVYAYVDSGVSTDFLILDEDGILHFLRVTIP